MYNIPGFKKCTKKKQCNQLTDNRNLSIPHILSYLVKNPVYLQTPLLPKYCTFVIQCNKTQLTICNCMSQVQCYDPETDTWLLRANIPIAKRCITAVSLNNLIYVCGGLTKSIFCYDPIEDYWMHVVQTFNKQVLEWKKCR